MTFRTKLLVVSALTVAGAVALVTGVVSVSARQAFERIDAERRRGIQDQFQREIQQEGKEVGHKVQRAASSPTVLQIAIMANLPQPDFAQFVDEARLQADAQGLDFLEILQQDYTIVSSAHSPARFGYKNDWLISEKDWSSDQPFLTRIPLFEGSDMVALAAIRTVKAADHKIHIIGAKRIGPQFIATLPLVPGTRALFWQPGVSVLPAKLDPLIAQVVKSKREERGNVRWTGSRASEESLLAIPLLHDQVLLGALLVGASLREQVWLEDSILWTGILVASAGILLGVMLGWWITARITKPVAELVTGVRAVAGGDWNAQVTVSSRDEIGQLAAAFNQMTAQLLEQRDRLIQSERVAAWRELARRLAHELKNPLFPLQITVENLQKARERKRAEFDEVFRESTATLLAELQHLKAIVGQFSDFAKMPKPEVEAVDANALVTDVVKLFDAQFQAAGRPAIEPVLELAPAPVPLQADPVQLSRALKNLVLNAMDAMPNGGKLCIRTQRQDGLVRIQVADSGQGLTEEECARLFTPYYTTKRNGTGLGLAIVQSVVSDHGGKISASGEPGRGATFTIDLPAALPARTEV